MKITVIKLFALILACSFIFVFSACDKGTEAGNETEKGTQNNSNEENGTPAITEQEIWLRYTTHSYSENCTYTYYYDEYGNEIKTVKEDLDGNVKATWLTEYDDNNNTVKRSVDTGKGEPFVQLIQIYDDNGRLIERREYDTSSEHIYTYQYDDQNRIASVKNGGQIVETYVYEADGSYKIQSANFEDEYTLYRADGKLEERHMGKSKVVNVYNDAGMLLEYVSYFNGEMTSKTVYHYDSNGNIIKIARVDDLGNEVVTGEAEYKLYTVKTK